jgi:hypothetical protein
MTIHILFLLVAMFFSWPTLASTGSDLGDGVRQSAAKKSESKGEDEKASEEEKAKAAEEEKKKKERMARVIVLRWKGTTTDFKDEGVQRNVKSRIDRADALFFPETDLYQNGRKLMDKTVVPALQPALVPDDNIRLVMNAVAEIQGVPYNGYAPHQWGLKAQELSHKVELLWFIDRKELREPLFLLYLQIGRAAENQNHPTPPFFEQIGTFSVNYYYYLASMLAQQDPGLMSKVTDKDTLTTVQYYLEQLQRGAFPIMKVDLELDDMWNGEEFLKTYEILFNGLPVEPDQNAQVPVFLGRTDIYLKRKDSGHGLSERLEVTRLDDKFYPVVQNARKRMGIDFIEQLFLHPNECSPELDGDILNYLSIYAKLHAKAEVYVAVPQLGNPNKTWIWRYDRKEAKLQLVGGGPDSFPVRFAFVASAGVLYNGASYRVDQEAPPAGQIPGISNTSSRFKYNLDAATLPITLDLRGHYNRLMIDVGAEIGFNITGDTWSEYYQTPENTNVYSNQRCAYDETTGGIDCDDATIVINNRAINRYFYMGAGVVLGRDAGIGFGPRFALRFGWTNVPHNLQPTLHFGWAFEPPFIPKIGERVRPLVDIDLRGGLAIPFGQHLYPDIAPVFGATIGAGLTF